MRRSLPVLAALTALALLYACHSSAPPKREPTLPPADAPSEVTRLHRLATRLRPLQDPLPSPKPGDWLAEHQERGQTFANWLEDEPITAREKRRKLYVQPLGPMSPDQRRVVELSTRFLGAYFQLPTVLLEPLPESVIPQDRRRHHPSWGNPQLNSVYILDEVLRPRVPADAAALIAFTALDLYPEESWNFVFGQASLRHRVGVWSIYRKGDPSDPAGFRQVLRRTLRTATHETGHMFSMRHCTAYSCNLCGSNSLEESDRQPLELCAECLPKLLYATRAEPRRRYRELIALCREQGLEEEERAFQKGLAAAGK